MCVSAYQGATAEASDSSAAASARLPSGPAYRWLCEYNQVMSTAALITFADFEQLPDVPGKRELIDGEILVMPPPELRHSELAKKVLFLLARNLDQSRIWGDHTGYRIAGGWIEPDVSVSWPDQRRDGRYFAGAPMVAVEILSTGEDIERKLSLYFAEGALEVWLFDLKRRSMTVYRRADCQVVRLDVSGEYRSDAAQTTVRPAELFG
jgi:Uma2 family endonuclease